MRPDTFTITTFWLDWLFVQRGAARAVRGFLAQLKSLVERNVAQ
jgi:hypothetical protein